MISSLTLENVRGLNRTFCFAGRNTLKGRNGAGKSTIKDAICFAYSGLDSNGNASPIHLITTGEERLKVEVVSSTGVRLTRTLTKSGHQTLKLCRGEVETTLTQAGLTSKLGVSPQAFLAMLVPGRFLRLPPQRQMGILGELLPPTDRRQLLQEISGLSLPPDDPVWGLIKLDSPRADLAIQNLVAERRRAQADRDTSAGRLEVYKSRSGFNEIAPPKTTPNPRLADLSSLKDAWQGYEHRQRSYLMALDTRRTAESANELTASERRALEAELEGLQFPPVPPSPESILPQLRVLTERKKSLPAKPSLHRLGEGDRCTSCGQLIGSKHREAVAAANAKAQSEWEVEAAAVTAHNQSLDLEISALQRAHMKVQADYEAEQRRVADISMRRTTVLRKLSGLAPKSLPEVPPEPLAPSAPFNQEEYQNLLKEEEQRRHQLGAYEMRQTQAAEAESYARSTEKQLESLAAKVNRLAAIEQAFLKIPQVEFERQVEMLKMPGWFRLVMPNENNPGINLELVKNGMPYEAFSTGQKMIADVVISLKLNALVKAPRPNLLFLDDSDLVDHLHEDLYADNDVQFFVAKVDRSVEDVQVTTW